MSRSSKIVGKPTEITLKFKNEKFDKKLKEITQEAGFYYYIRSQEEDEEGENVLVPFPFKFIWLEEAQSVSGYNSKEEKGVYSNEILINPNNQLVKKYKKKDLTVKCGNETIAVGPWHEIKEKVGDMGGKYCVPVYALAEINNEWVIIRILMSGGSRASWFDISRNKSKILNNFIVAEGFEEVEMKTGDTYQKPIFKFGDMIPENLQEKIKEATKIVDDYFEFILSEKEFEEPIDEEPVY